MKIKRPSIPSNRLLKKLDWYIIRKKIEIKDGVPQSKAYFVNVVDGEYVITEIASATDGSYLKAGTAFGNYELAKIETTHDGASGDNDGKIDKDQWTDEVTVTNTFKAGSTSVTLGGKKSFTGWPADVEAPVFTYTLSENGSVIDSKTTNRVYSEGTTGVIEENKTSHASFTNTKSGVPVTGEKDRLLTYLAMMLTSGLGLLGTGIAEKKRRKRTDHKG